MRTATTMTELATADLLRLAQWLSPAFPLSGYAYSHGLEAAIADGTVHDAETCRAWVATVLRHGTGALDAWAVAAVLRGEDADEVADLLRARAGCAERWEETRAMGAAFCATTEAIGAPALPPHPHPLPVALALRARGMARAPVVALYLQALAGQLVSAATRLVPLGQVEAQRALAALHPLVAELAETAPDAPPGGAALLSELAAMAHETLQPRMFRT
jgi:urease accessory protein